MKKQRKKNIVKQKKEYNKKILYKLNETGYQDVGNMIEGLQKRIKILENTINKKEVEIINNKKGNK